MAIYKAIEYAKKARGKYIICTDSMSSIEAIKNTSNNAILVSLIRDMCIKHSNKIKLFWVPGHKGIKGNETADKEARLAACSPCTLFDTCESDDLYKQIHKRLREDRLQHWANFKHPYMNCNKNLYIPKFPATATRSEITTFVRLRIGHTKLSHQHLLLGEPPKDCPFCNSRATITHILDECAALGHARTKHFGEIIPTTVLSTINLGNILLIYNFLKYCNLLNII